MPIYLVRWPDLSAALVSARNESELLHTLDQVENPEGCTWSVYRGPLHLELRLNVDVKGTSDDQRVRRPLAPEDLAIGDVTRFCDGNRISVQIPDTEVGGEMSDVILRTAFPAVHAAIALADDEEPDEGEVREALKEELEVLVQASWRQHQTERRPDEDSRIAAQLGTSPKLVAEWTKHARSTEGSPSPKPPDRGAKKPKARDPK